MRFNNIARLAFLVPALMLGSACTDLGLEPTASVSNDAYFETVQDFEAAIVGAYDALSSASYYGRSIHLMSDIMGEDIKQNSSANRYQEFADFEGQVVTGHDYETDLWQLAYIAINRVNMVLSNGETFEPPAALAGDFNQLLGEAYALRGLVHFDLAKMYGQHYTFTADASHPGVPIVLEMDITALPARNTVAQVYAQAISDLNMGISMMTDTRDGAYMMSKEAAQAILSRIYLYMDDWGNAESMATTVINSGKYSLLSGSALADIFVAGNTSEAIFEIPMSADDTRGSNHLGGMYRDSGYGDYLPATDLLDLIDAADIRWGWFDVDPALAGAYASYRVDKWPTDTNWDNIPVIRLAELYLIRAEARARLGQDATAQADLNMIRQRSLPTAPAVTATGQALLDEIALERRIELGYEGHRVHDLMRYKQGFTRNDCTGDVCSITYPCQFCILPIPQPETDTNTNIAQNAGYAGG
ncbi:MAG: RagB/SusD family nutrient uptake outer membrane protein [Gemmatimonadetes bacterium]|nr:RagB/SusD family nutrient uptake outer membrane protein [Gemmatimonadota bacterium]NNM03781.1 RagB/SusD family nutrient uptake outer membrane protein [Gemmatimonadota bacterium]